MKYNIIGKVIIVITLLFCMPYIFCNQANSYTSHDKSILIINSYTETSLWSNSFIDPVYKEVRTKNEHIDVYTEHMNMLTIHDEQAMEEYQHNLFSRYSQQTPNLIILIGIPAWALLNEEIEKKWKNVPVILCTEKDYIGPRNAYLQKHVIADNDKVQLKDYNGEIPLTVLNHPFHIKETIGLMNRLLLQMDTLMFLSDEHYISAQSRNDVDQIIKSKYPHVEIKHLIADEVTNDALIDSLRNTSKTTGILFFSWFQQEKQQGNAILISNISRIISNYTQSPIFTLHNNAIETNGLVGGCFWDNNTIGTKLVEIVNNLLTQAPDKKVHTVNLGTPPPIVNYLDFTAAHLSLSRCPSDTVFYMKPLTFWQQYRYIILIVCILIIFFWRYISWLKKINKERDARIELMKGYQSLFENMPILYAKEKLIYDKEGNIVDFVYESVNPTFESYILPKEKIIGRKCSDINQSHHHELMNLYNITIKQNKELTFQHYYTEKDKYLTIMVNPSKQEEYVDVFCVDNTQLSQLQQMLRSVNHKLHTALDVANIIPWKWDLKKGVILCDVNKVTERNQEGTTIDEQQLSIPDHLYFSKIHKQDRERIQQSYKRLANGEISKIKEEFQVAVRENGHIKFEWVEVQATVDEKDKDGNIYTIVGSSVVITQRKEMEKDLIRAKEKAEESNRLKSAFLANMSHEIRTPLNAIVGFSGILASTEADEEEERKEYINIIENNNHLLLQLINDILDLSKIEAGTLEFVYTNIDTNQLFSEIEESAKLRNPKPEVQIIYNQEMPECYIRADKNRLTQVITNMINNAMKFTNTGSIQFGYYKRDNDFLYFYVSDTGCGIPHDKQNSVFGRFVKLNTFAQGTGLGLSICQTIIENMGGQIGVKSEEGVGTTFWFTLPYQPIDKEELCNKVDIQPVINITKCDKLTILIAEDNDNNFRLFEKSLKKDYNILHAWNGEEAVEMFKKYNPHLIIMDINMPKMNGYEATRIIRELSPAIPVIAISAFAYAKDEQQILENGFDAFTSKPIDEANLQTQIISLLKKRLVFLM